MELGVDISALNAVYLRNTPTGKPLQPRRPMPPRRSSLARLTDGGSSMRGHVIS
jgi:hypothetical protein